ncbi:hypothetical protein TKK_0009238 [Trichogramma kaykai]
MNHFEIDHEDLVKIFESMVDEVVHKRRQSKCKVFAKINFDLTDLCDDFFEAQVTVCSSECSGLKFFMLEGMKSQVSAQKLILGTDENAIVGFVREKSCPVKRPRRRQRQASTCSETEQESEEQQELQQSRVFRDQKIVCRRNTSLSLMEDEPMSGDDEQLELKAIKRYVSFKLLFKVLVQHIDSFASLMLRYILHTEQLDPNIKFVLRRNNSKYIYWNIVPMDDIVVSCGILTSALHGIFQRSQDQAFRQEIMSLLDIERPSLFKQTVGCMLLAKANQNYDPSIFEAPRPSTSSDQLQPSENDVRTREQTDVDDEVPAKRMRFDALN